MFSVCLRFWLEHTRIQRLFAVGTNSNVSLRFVDIFHSINNLPIRIYRSELDFCSDLVHHTVVRLYA